MTTAKQDLIDLSKDTISRCYEDWCEGHIGGFNVPPEKGWPGYGQKVILAPALSTMFYDLYKVWCGKQGVKPGSAVKMVDMLLKRFNCTSDRLRMTSQCKDSPNPQTFIFPNGIETVPLGKEIKAWLGACVDEFHHTFEEYKGE